jgi:menaquinone-dependent protoporphyrinogen IX oxidase
VSLSPINQITDEFGRVVVIDKVRYGDSLFTLTVSSFINRHAEAVAGLPSVFYIWILVDVADHGFATNPFSNEFTVPPKKLPTSRSSLPTTKP